MKKLVIKFGLVGILYLALFNISWGQTFTPDNDVNISISITPSLTFSESITYPNDGMFRVSLMKLIDGTWFEENYYNIFVNSGIAFPGSGNIVLEPNKITISPGSDLDYSSDYAIVIPGNLTNTDGFSGTNETTWNFTTETGPPQWPIAPELHNQTTDSITLSGEIDQDASYYYVITENNIAPTALQIEAGHNRADEPAIIASNEVVTANTAFSERINISGLELYSVYYLHVVATNGSSYSTVYSPPAIDRVPPDLQYFKPNNGSVVVPVDTVMVLSYSKKIHNTDGTLIDNTNISDYIIISEGSDTISYSADFSTNGCVITLTPDAAMHENTSYTVSFSKFEDPFGNEQRSVSGNRSFTTDIQLHWSGQGDVTNWSDNANWAGNYYNKKSVVIPASASSFPVIGTGNDISVHNLTIEAGAELTHNDGILNVSGVFTLESSSTINASYLFKGGDLIMGNAQNFIVEQVISYSDRTYHVTPPVYGTTQSTAGMTNGIYYYDNVQGQYSPVAYEDVISPGKGYLTRNTTDIEFIGTPIKNDTTIDVTRSPGGGLGWNLVGNPFTASIDWGQLNLTNVENSFWIWLNNYSPGIYGTYNGNTGAGTVIDIEGNEGIIPSNHAFWIKVPDGASTGSIDIPKSAMSKNDTSYLKSYEKTNATKFPTIKLTSEFNEAKDQTAIALVPEATNGIDIYDTEKKFSNNEGFVEIYSFANGQPMAINGMPEFENEFKMPIGFNSVKSGNCTISLSLNTLPENMSLTLWDKEKGQYTNLTSGTSYTFQIDGSGRIDDRFSLMFAKHVPTKIENLDINSENIYIFSNKTEIITYIGALNNPKYQLFNIHGQLLLTGNLNSNSKNSIKVNHKEVVIFVVTSEKARKTYKTVF
jgi:hypothetical protein